MPAKSPRFDYNRPRFGISRKSTTAMAFAPIWKDYAVTLDTGVSYADFEIRVGDDTGPLIYSGRAYTRPGETDPTARINDICAGYIAGTFPNLGTRFTPMQVSETFSVVVGGSEVDNVTFVNDWSYDDSKAWTAGDVLSDPVNGELDPRQVLFFSVLSGQTSVNVTIYFTDGTSAVVAVPVAFSADFNDDFNGDFAQQDDPSRSGTAILDLSAFSGVDRVAFLGITMKVRQQGCARYCAAYVNAFGGWDTLILDGYTTRQDALVRHTIDVEHDNGDLAARGRKDYAIEVTPSWTLRTGFLTDAQSLRMRHLLNSTEVYLQDLMTGEWRPVVIADTETPVQSFKGNGRQRNEYTFNAQLAQERFRR